MRQLTRCLLLVFSVALINAKVMVIHRSDGRSERYYASDVKKMSFEQDLTDIDRPAPRQEAVLTNRCRAIGRIGVVRVDLAAPSPVTLDLYDMRGVRLSGIRHSALPTGRHRLSVLPRGGKHIAHGPYIVRVAIGCTVSTHRIVLGL